MSQRIKSLDGVRGIAILAVLFYHAYYWAGDGTIFSAPWRWLWYLTRYCWMGVYVFFILSGYLITVGLLANVGKPDFYSRFYFARAVRILPVYWLTLLLLIPLQGFHLFHFYSLFFASHWTGLFGVQNWYPVLWTLTAEIHFYLLWPLAVRRFGPRGLAVIAFAVILLEPVLRGCGYLLELKEQPWIQFDPFFYGVLLALYYREARARSPLQIAGACFSLAVIAWLLQPGLTTKLSIWGATFQISWISLISTGLVALALAPQPFWQWLFGFSWLREWGQLSYSVYLLHCIILDRLDVLVMPSLVAWGVPPAGMALARLVACLGYTYLVALGIRRWLELPLAEWSQSRAGSVRSKLLSLVRPSAQSEAES